jgi:ribonuclease Z
VRSAETVASVQAYHTTPAQAAHIANSAQVRALMLTHIVPPAADRAALLQDIRALYLGPAMVGEDLMRFDLVNRIMRNGNTAIAL